jgi:hypothetical protein
MLHPVGGYARRGGIVAALLAVTVSLFPSPAAAANGELTRLTEEACEGGSSDPTAYGNNRRLAISAGGRRLAIYDPHGSGVQLSWKDAGSAAWREETQGAVSDGQLLGPDDPNDRPASIVVDAAGTTAWVVWAGYTFDRPSEVRMRQLTNLDGANGPTVGPEVTLRPGEMGNVRVDAVYHDGSVYVSWTERTGDTTYQLMAGRLSDASATPSLTDVAALWTGSAKEATGTLVSTAAGLRVAARTASLRIYSHNSGTSWTQGSGSASLKSRARPSAVVLPSGAILVAAQSDFSTDVVKVFRFANNGSNPAVELQTGAGYAQPILVHTGGESALVVMVKGKDTVVSRARTGGTWSGRDATELTAADSGNYKWPNALRQPTNGRLELLVSGTPCPSSPASQREVLHLSRPLNSGPGPKANSNVNIRHRAAPHRFKGRVASPAASCERGRTVVIKRRRPGPDRTIGSDRTNANGKYVVRHRKTGKKKTYYARVRGNAGCRADNSGNTRVR